MRAWRCVRCPPSFGIAAIGLGPRAHATRARSQHGRPKRATRERVVDFQPFADRKICATQKGHIAWTCFDDELSELFARRELIRVKHRKWLEPLEWITTHLHVAFEVALRLAPHVLFASRMRNFCHSDIPAFYGRIDCATSNAAHRRSLSLSIARTDKVGRMRAVSIRSSMLL
jgi:hypothetical protein